jgi:2-methylcitrate dehydratase PrpD
MHGVMDLLAAYRSEGGRTDGLTRIDCGVLSGGMSLVAEPLARKRTVANMVDAQFSMPFGAALTLTRGASSLRDFSDAARLAPEMQRLMDLTHTHASTALDAAYPARWGAEVTLSFADGEVIELRANAFHGSPGWPADDAEIAGKAISLLGDAAAKQLLSALDAADRGERMDPAGLASACAADQQRPVAGCGR